MFRRVLLLAIGLSSGSTGALSEVIKGQISNASFFESEIELGPTYYMKETSGVVRPTSYEGCRLTKADSFVEIQSRDTWLKINEAVLSAAGLRLERININNLRLTKRESLDEYLELDHMSFPIARVSNTFFDRKFRRDEEPNLLDASDLSLLINLCRMKPRAIPLNYLFWKNERERRANGSDRFYALNSNVFSGFSNLRQLPNSPFLFDEQNRVRFQLPNGDPNQALAMIEKQIRYWSMIKRGSLYNYSDAYFLEVLSRRQKVSDIGVFEYAIQRSNFPFLDQTSLATTLSALIDQWDDIQKQAIASLDTVVDEYLELLRNLKVDFESAVSAKRQARAGIKDFVTASVWEYQKKYSLPDNMRGTVGRPILGSGFSSPKQSAASKATAYDKLATATTSADGPATGIASYNRVESVQRWALSFDWVHADNQMIYEVNNFDKDIVVPDSRISKSIDLAMTNLKVCMLQLYRAGAKDLVLLDSILNNSFHLKEYEADFDHDIWVEFFEIRYEDASKRRCSFHRKWDKFGGLQRYVDNIDVLGGNFVNVVDVSHLITALEAITEFREKSEELDGLSEQKNVTDIRNIFRANSSTEVDIVTSLLGNMKDEILQSRSLIEQRSILRHRLLDVGYWTSSGYYRYALPEESSYLYDEDESKLKFTSKHRFLLSFDMSERDFSNFAFRSTVDESAEISLRSEKDVEGRLDKLSSCGIRIVEMHSSSTNVQSFVELEVDPLCRRFEENAPPFASISIEAPNCVKLVGNSWQNCAREQFGLQTNIDDAVRWLVEDLAVSGGEIEIHFR